MGKVIGVISIKGGVGKTTLATSLAADLANNRNKKVLLIDANYSAPNVGLHMDIAKPVKTIHDILSGKSSILGAIHKRHNVDVIPGSYIYNKQINAVKLKNRLAKVKDDYDFVILDSSPSLNDEILSTILASDSLFVVSTPDYPTLVCSLRAAVTAKEKGRPITGIILNKLRDPKYELKLEEVEESTGIPVVARVPDDKVSLKAVFRGVPIPICDNNSKFAREVNKLSAALTNEVEEKSFWQKLFNFRLGREQVNRQVLRENFYNPVIEEKK